MIYELEDFHNMVKKYIRDKSIGAMGDDVTTIKQLKSSHASHGKLDRYIEKIISHTPNNKVIVPMPIPTPVKCPKCPKCPKCLKRPECIECSVCEPSNYKECDCKECDYIMDKILGFLKKGSGW